MRDSPHDRRRTILRALSPTTVHSVQALSRLTGVSVITIRRDLAELVREGLVTRVHGGALRAPRRGAARPASMRRRQDVEIKRRLARATAELIEEVYGISCLCLPCPATGAPMIVPLDSSSQEEGA